MKNTGFLGIDAGTQGLSVVFVDQRLKVLAHGEHGYDFVPGLDVGCYEQAPADWWDALRGAMAQVRAALADSEMEVLAIGISGQMHGEVLSDAKNNVLGPARLWCDSRNDVEGEELTDLFNVKIPKRMTVARWLWTIRQRKEIASKVARITTPAGWLAYQLTGEWNLGVGDAAGMFPIDQQTLDFDQRLLDRWNEHFEIQHVSPLQLLLPRVRRAGEVAGRLSTAAANQLGLQPGIPCAPAEGDQPAALAGSLIGDAGTVGISFGTSVCANSVGDRPFRGVDKAVDHFCAVDGKPINMVWLRNGTTFMNAVIAMFGKLDTQRADTFRLVMPQLLAAAPDCGGILALPFMDDEPGLGVAQGGTAMLFGLNSNNATPGNVAKAALLATMFNLRWGSEVLDAQNFPRQELVLTGGITKTPELGQILADVFQTKTRLLEAADEGTAWGATVLAAYTYRVLSGDQTDWSDFLRALRPDNAINFTPIPANVETYNAVYKRYKALVSSTSATQM
ncbi:MAG TPA: FGGY-family carbohydrate kinase [Pirellulaceae bacterium]|nr:FGGY-family carbohydrate kinase [Pirellulaceae bacterium]HMO92083.1 FGGY-family carbohydrate kinase [Pirellulaceae bacterium]HMP69329.1 FGGY-family carbohydrate kinase [Pirellulaceae bacterium]